jgi:hypothetical protein
LGGGIKRNVGSEGGLEALQKALANGNHQRYVDDAAALQDASATTEGNAILGHLLGIKDVSRQVATQAAANTGIDAGIIKKILPMVAAAAMGALSKQTSGGSMLKGGGGALGTDWLAR